MLGEGERGQQLEGKGPVRPPQQWQHRSHQQKYKPHTQLFAIPDTPTYCNACAGIARDGLYNNLTV